MLASMPVFETKSVGEELAPDGGLDIRSNREQAPLLQLRLRNHRNYIVRQY